MKFTKRKPPSGFALVATLVMMILLVTIAVGLLGLSTIELRKSGNGNAMERARANARMGLMIALGELQENLGPDQRVSGDARVAHRGASTPENPHWVSVWKTTQEEGEPWIKRDAEKGGLTDLRQTGSWNAQDEKVTTLVSGNENEIAYEDDSASGSQDFVSLVDKGSLGEGADDEDIVRVPRVAISNVRKNNGSSSQGRNSSNNKGSYAWWVGDLGAQANVATRDATPDTTVGKYQALMLAQDSSWKAYKDDGVKQGDKELEDDERAKLATESQLSLVQPGMRNRRFHDFTVWSAGLPVDVREGGWKKDLSSFMTSKGAIAEYKGANFTLPGLKDLDNVVGANVGSAKPAAGKRLDPVSPKFGLLRKWAARAEGASMDGYKVTTEKVEVVAKATGGYNNYSIDFNNRTTSPLMPILVEGSIYYNLSSYNVEEPFAPYGLRLHLYPRVALWNPYNFPLTVPASGIFMHINGAKQIEVTMEGGSKRHYRMFWGYNGGGSEGGGGSRGSMFFKMDGATLEPGQTLVWSPSRNTVYNEMEGFAGNTLSASVAPSVNRAFHMSRRDKVPLFQPLAFPGEKVSDSTVMVPNRAEKRPVEWREAVFPKPVGDVQNGDTKFTQADDYVMSWKPFTGGDIKAFERADMGRFVSCAYQYGDEDEMPVEWTSLDPVPFAQSTATDTIISQVPDKRTRDGFRLRWSEETKSNLIGSGSLSGSHHLEDSAIGNWNMRASWAFRNPFDNVSDLAPNFFGVYTRDLFDGEIGWDSIAPRSSGGKSLGDPFDQPVNGIPQRILFDVPRRGTEIASLGAFQHANFSEFIWHPTYAFGNSLADPRVPIEHTEPDRSENINKDKGGWNQRSIGFSTDGRSDNNGDESRTNVDNWAYTARQYLQQVPQTQSVVYDLSYELNHALWDRYFLASGTLQEKRNFFESRAGSRLPNGRMRTNGMIQELADGEITDQNLYHTAASRMLVDGAFNVNSTSVSAWESLLLSGVDEKYGDKVAFPRFLNAEGAEWDGTKASDPAAWSGQRVFDRSEITKLAEQIVKQVQERGPFLSLGDFVNRRLAQGEFGKKGALQAAIDLSGVNEAFNSEWPLDNSRSLPNYKSVDNIEDSTRMEQTLKPETTAWGALGFLTQADLLQFIGPALSARSDTFRVRAYGESLDGAGKVVARAYCEAVVQRSPNYVDPTDDAMATGDVLTDLNKKFGRRFELVSFRWLKDEEI